MTWRSWYNFDQISWSDVTHALPSRWHTWVFFYVYQGTILDCDAQLAFLHGYMSPVEVMGLKVNKLIPSFVLPTPGQQISKVTMTFLFWWPVLVFPQERYFIRTIPFLLLLLVSRVMILQLLQSSFNCRKGPREKTSVVCGVWWLAFIITGGRQTESDRQNKRWCKLPTQHSGEKVWERRRLLPLQR